MKPRTFYVLWTILFATITATSFYGLVGWTAQKYGISWDQSKEIVFKVIVTCAFYKKVIILGMLGALSYLSARYTLLGRI